MGVLNSAVEFLSDIALFSGTAMFALSRVICIVWCTNVPYVKIHGKGCMLLHC